MASVAGTVPGTCATRRGSTTSPHRLLTRDTRLIEAAAILGTGSPLAPASALAEVDDPTPLLDEAHTAGLLTMRERQGIVTLLFPDPMTSAAVTDEIGPARWRELHARAATLVDDEGDALFHLVSATPAADGTLADKLDRFARQRAADGAWAQAAEALITAGRITPERDLRTQRLIRGVDALTGAADLPQAQTFVPEIESAPGGPMRNAVLGYLAIQRGRAAEAHYLLSEAWTMANESETDPELAAMICQRMVLHSLARMRGDELVAWADRASSLVPGDAPAVVESNAIRGLGLGMTGHIDEARASYAGLADHVRLGAQSQRIRMAEGWLALALDAPIVPVPNWKLRTHHVPRWLPPDLPVGASMARPHTVHPRRVERCPAHRGSGSRTTRFDRTGSAATARSLDGGPGACTAR